MSPADQALYDFARTWARVWAWNAAQHRAGGIVDDEAEEAGWAEVLALVDKLADERVVAFARVALLAGDGIGDNVSAAFAVRRHVRNMIAQIEAREKAAAKP